MRFRTLCLLLVFLMISVCSHAEARCPWLNAATASGVLHGDVHMTVMPISTNGDATCEFMRGEGADAATLRIEVKSMPAPQKQFAALLSQCGGTQVPLAAIGNKTVQCVLPSRGSEAEVKVIGRVRARSFVVIVKSPPNGPARSGNGLSNEIRNLAEQIAGILF